jgi:hypothetical protein
LTRKTFGASAPPRQRNQQWNERDPRDCGMTVLGETQREQNARGQG